MTCIIIEDQPPAQRILKKYIADFGSLELMATYVNALDAIDFLKENSVDIIFLDIHLPKISGMEFLKTLKSPASVILTTAFPDFALESYEFDVVDYLLKPFSFQRFAKAVTKVQNLKAELSSENVSDHIFIKNGYEHIKVNINEIIFIKSDRDYTEIHLKDSKHLSSETLKHWNSLLAEKSFFRIHKSFIINSKKIQKLSASQVELEGKQIIPIGRAFKSALADFI